MSTIVLESALRIFFTERNARSNHRAALRRNARDLIVMLRSRRDLARGGK